MKYERQKTKYTGENNPNYKGGPIVVPCLHCGKDVEMYLSIAMKKARTGQKTFCSRECHDDYRRTAIKISKPQVGRNHHRWSGPKHCCICGDELVGSHARKNKTCSKKECRSEIKRQSHFGKNNGRWVDIEIYCRQCGNEITHHQRLSVSFCSRKCMGQWQSDNMSGENSPLYKGNCKGEYAESWTMSLRKKIRNRDGNLCVVCKSPPTNMELDVHHIDMDKENCEENNLITLCRSCHHRVHHGNCDIHEYLA